MPCCRIVSPTTSFFVFGRPRKLLLISTGNIHNQDLETLLIGNLRSITEFLTTNNFVELGRTSIIVHG